MQIFLKLLSFLQAPRSPFLFPCSHCLVQLAAASCQCLGDGGIRGQCARGTWWERDHTAQWKHGAILWALMAARNFLLTRHLPTSSLSHMNARQSSAKTARNKGVPKPAEPCGSTSQQTLPSPGGQGGSSTPVQGERHATFLPWLPHVSPRRLVPEASERECSCPEGCWTLPMSLFWAPGSNGTARRCHFYPGVCSHPSPLPARVYPCLADSNIRHLGGKA